MNNQSAYLNPRDEPYQVVCAEVKRKTNSNGKEYLSLTFMDRTARKVNTSLYMSSDQAKLKSREVMNQFLAASGHLNPNQVKNFTELIGRRCLIKVGRHNFHGRNFTYVEEFLPIQNIPENLLGSRKASDIFGFEVKRFEPLPLEVLQLINSVKAELKNRN